MANSTLTAQKCVLQFGDKNGSYSLTKLKTSANNDDIALAASAINDLQALPYVKMLKVEEFELTE